MKDKYCFGEWLRVMHDLCWKTFNKKDESVKNMVRAEYKNYLKG